MVVPLHGQRSHHGGVHYPLDIRPVQNIQVPVTSRIRGNSVITITICTVVAFVFPRPSLRTDPPPLTLGTCAYTDVLQI